MPTVNFNSVYLITPLGTEGSTNLNNAANFDVIYTRPLSPGDTFTIDPTPAGGQTFTGTYLGVSAAGELKFSFTIGGQTFTAFFTDKSYPNRSDPPTFNPVDFCFLAGTRILTPHGERVVESLVIGDLVVTADGRAVPVKWLGRQTIPAMYGLSPWRSPVSIATGALGEGLPSRELRLTADHALLIDDVLVQAGALVNGSTIRRLSSAELAPFFTVYHIETENHETILAEAVPAETFIDNVSRRDFDNYAEYEALYGEETMIQELDHPRAMSGRQVPRATRERLAAVAMALGYEAEIAA